MKTKTEAYKILIAAGWTVEEIEQVFPPQKESAIDPTTPLKSPDPLPSHLPTWISPLHVKRSSGTVPPKPPAPPPQSKRSSFVVDGSMEGAIISYSSSGGKMITLLGANHKVAYVDLNGWEITHSEPQMTPTPQQQEKG